MAIYSNKQKSSNLRYLMNRYSFRYTWVYSNQYRSSRRPIIDAWECQASIDSLAEAYLCARTF